MAKARKNDLEFLCTGIIEICHIPSPHWFPSFLLPVSVHESQTEFLLLFDFSLSLHSPPLRTSSRFLPIEYDGKCEKWFNHIFDSLIAPYLTEILHIWRESSYILTKEHPYLKKLWSFDVHLWVMVCQIGMGYGIWESLANLAGNRLGGHRKVWVTGVYGLSQVWIKTEATVVKFDHPPFYCSLIVSHLSHSPQLSPFSLLRCLQHINQSRFLLQTQTSMMMMTILA